jgi:hypothetical protein
MCKCAHLLPHVQSHGYTCIHTHACGKSHTQRWAHTHAKHPRLLLKTPQASKKTYWVPPLLIHSHRSRTWPLWRVKNRPSLYHDFIFLEWSCLYFAVEYSQCQDHVWESTIIFTSWLIMDKTLTWFKIIVSLASPKWVWSSVFSLLPGQRLSIKSGNRIDRKVGG